MIPAEEAHFISQMVVVLVIGSLLLGCAPAPTPTTAHNTYLARRPDGTLFDSHAELVQYLKEHPEERSRIEAQTRMTSHLERGDPSPGSLAYLDFRNGFRDLTFRDPPPQGMRVVEAHGDTTYYTRPSDDLTIGDARIKEMTYGFYKGQFYSVLLQTEGLINSRALLEVLRQAYGVGARPNQFMERYVWDGSRVLLYYDQKPISDDAIALLQSVPLKHEKETDEKAKARQGVSGL
jgi:hypothetical protein